MILSTIGKVSNFDMSVIAVYLLAVVGVGCLAGLKRKKTADASSYFLADNSLRWPSVRGEGAAPLNNSWFKSLTARLLRRRCGSAPKQPNARSVVRGLPMPDHLCRPSPTV